MTSGKVLKKLRSVIEDPATSFAKIPRSELEECAARFEALITKRNALIHAHPATDADGSQVLVYQTRVTKPLPDMKWPREQVVAVLAEFDQAACIAGELFDKLR